MILFNKSNLQMGNTFDICQQPSPPSAFLPGDEVGLDDEKNYQISDMNHADSQLQQQISNLKQQESFEEFSSNKKVMKHKQKDEYYIGEWKDHIRKGQGISYSKGEYLYYGEFDQVPNGTGILKLYKQNIVVEGQMKNGQPQGLCSIKDMNGLYTFQGIINDKHLPSNGKFQINNEAHPEKSYSIILEDYPNNKAKINYKDGTEYIGEISFQTLLPEGQGQQIYPNKSKYVGGWLDGAYHGSGKFFWIDGSSYQGDYQNGIKKGIGRYEYVSKKYYQGQWSNGKQQGKGALYSPQGQILKEGIWENGKYIGKSKQTAESQMRPQQ